MTSTNVACTLSSKAEKSADNGLIARARRLMLVVLAILALAVLSGGVLYRVGSGAAPLSGIALLGVLAALAGMNYRYSRDILYPAFMISTVWLIALATYVFSPVEVNALSWETCGIFAGGIAAFSTACALGDWIQTKVPIQSTSLKRINLQPSTLLVIYSAITLPLFVYDTARIAGTSFSLSSAFIIAARLMIVEAYSNGVMPYGNKIVSTAPMMAVFTAFVIIGEDRKGFVKIASIGIAIMLAILTGFRVWLLQLFCGWFVLYLLRRSDRSFSALAKRMILVGVAVLILLSATTMLTKLETQSKGGETMQIVTNMSVEYVVGPLAAFDYSVQHPSLFARQPHNTFTELVALYSTITGAPYHAPPVIEPWASVPFSVNVYTAFKTFYVDFGAVGCFLAFGVIGLAQGFIFRAAVRGSRIGAFLLAYLTFALVFTPFLCAYHLLLRYVYVGVYVVVYFVILQRVPKITWGSSTGESLRP